MGPYHGRVLITIDKSASILEAMKENPRGTDCSLCGADVPKCHETAKACVCDRCTWIKAERRCKPKAEVGKGK